MIKKFDNFISKAFCKIFGHRWIVIDYRGKKMCKTCFKIALMEG